MHNHWVVVCQKASWFEKYEASWFEKYEVSWFERQWAAQWQMQANWETKELFLLVETTNREADLNATWATWEH